MVSVPRIVECITIKRNVPLLGRSYGHWWIELDDESYGWWPDATPLRLRDVFGGTRGVLNGGPDGDTASRRDPNHGLVADYAFHPVLITAKSDDQLRVEIRAFAQTFRGGWRWSTRPTMNCRVFQLALFDAVGLVDGTGNYHTRGDGCPAMAPMRRAVARLTGKRRWPGNLPKPGARVADSISAGQDRP